MSMADGIGVYNGRQRDDETQAFLIDFFRNAAPSPQFADMYHSLTPDEQQKLSVAGQL